MIPDTTTLTIYHLGSPTVPLFISNWNARGYSRNFSQNNNSDRIFLPTVPLFNSILTFDHIRWGDLTKNTMTKTMTRLIAFLTIENINLIIHSDLSIKSDRQSSSWKFQIYSLKFQFSWKYLNFFLFLDFFQVPFISFWKVTDFVLKLVVLPPEHFGFLPCFGICNLQFSIFNLIFQFACFVLAGQQFTTTSTALLPLQKDPRKGQLCICHFKSKLFYFFQL